MISEGAELMKITFPRLYRTERKAEPCMVSIPFPAGAFREGMCLRITDGENVLPVQTRILSRWPDGSVRFLSVRFQADLPGMREKSFEASVTETKTEPETGISLTRNDTGFLVDAGEGGPVLRLRHDSTSLIDHLWDGRVSYQAEQFAGPVLKDGNGRKLLPRYGRWHAEEEGPLVAVLRCTGEMAEAVPENASGSHERPRFDAKLTLYAGKPWLEVSFRLINATSVPLHAASLVFAILADEGAVWDASLGCDALREKGDSVGEGSRTKGQILEEDGIYETTGTGLLPEIEKEFAGKPLRLCVGSSNYRTNFTVSGGPSVERIVDTASLMAEANEHFTEVFYGTFFADRTAEQSGVCATVFQAQQNYPKAVKSDISGVYVMLVPENIEKVVFESGMSREQRFLLHFHGAGTPLEQIDYRSLIYQMPDRPFLHPEVYRDAGVTEEIYLPPEQTDPDVETALINRCDGHSRSFGMLNFGDAPDMNYTRQGRGRGMLVWTNNEYDFPHACALLYMRTGERRFLDYLIASGSHWMDVDVCHYSRDPLLLGGQWEHSRRHVLDSCMVCSHQWVEGLLDLYHLTGENRALITAIGIGENVLRMLETPAYRVSGESNARETGWALRSLTALFRETGELKWLEKAEWIVSQFREWSRKYGSWVAPYTDNTLIHVPFMIAVAVGSLYRYYRVFPGEKLKELILAAVNDLTEACMTPSGLFYYKELPSLNRLGNNTVVLEALAIAYRLTGEIRYLQMGIPTFRRDIASGSRPVGTKTVMEGTVVLDNDPPKHFAQSFVPLSVFYQAAAETGLLKETGHG